MRRYLLLPFLLALPASLKAWSVAAWNQHRKSSYYQKVPAPVGRKVGAKAAEVITSEWLVVEIMIQ